MLNQLVHIRDVAIK